MNRLAAETSLYLRQHAGNPVHWQPWGDEAWAEAKRRQVPVLVSIGYSSCHWCHVMEHEVFEKEILATAMNEALVCIKVDREERPDIDMIYMEAVQRMGLGGGWPLNVFCTPEGEPFYGGTYFPPPNWAQVVKEISRAWREHETDLRQTAAEFRKALQEEVGDAHPVHARIEALKQGLERLLRHADPVDGGIGGAPKFPLPGKYQFLLEAAGMNPEAGKAARLAVRRMAEGGLYDHVGGGFFRYSTDAQWFAPHFEKMLYDNAQMLSLYAQAYRLSPDAETLRVLEETIGWLKREMTDACGAFYSSIDADSEGEEGRFYTWPTAELRELWGERLAELGSYFQIAEAGNWEHGRNILARPHDSPLPEGWEAVRQALFERREGRVRATLDTKILTGWNGLTVIGLVDAYRWAGIEAARDMAVACAAFFAGQITDGRRLPHEPGKAGDGFLEDYAAWALALTRLFQATQNPLYLDYARRLTERVLEAFADGDRPMLYYTSEEAERLLARKKEVNDSVTPSSNGLMAMALFELGALLEEDRYRQQAEAMLHARGRYLETGLTFSTAWAALALRMELPGEVSLVGGDAEDWARRLAREPYPNLLIYAATHPVTEGVAAYKKPRENETGAWLCTRGACLAPVYSWDALLGLLDEQGYRLTL